MLHEAVTLIFKPLCSLAYHGCQCNEKSGMFRHVRPVLSSYAGDIPEYKELLGMK